MEKCISDLLEGATNVYRTREFIVKQVIEVLVNRQENNSVVSHDTFIRRTRLRDRFYEILYCARKNIDGKRLPSTMYNRKYVV